MFFLPAELAKEAGNELLSHWMGNLGTSQDVSFTLCHVSQFSFLAGQCNSFPTLPPLSELLPRVYSGSVSTFFGSFFAFFVDSNSVMLIELSIKCCCIIVWQTKMHSVCENLFTCMCSWTPITWTLGNLNSPLLQSKTDFPWICLIYLLQF